MNRKVIPIPVRPANIPESSQWLSGEGAGSWFHVHLRGEKYEITRFSPEGLLECKGIFLCDSESSFKMDHPFKVDYPSNCSKITLIQLDKKVVFVNEQ